MRIDFEESFRLPAGAVYPYFRTPADWVRLYGIAGAVEDRGGGWWAVPLRRFPFPLVAKVTEDRPAERVRWVFGGFWRGTGEVRFTPTPDGVLVKGFEEIAVRGLSGLSRFLEKAFLERRFRAIWERGWRRLRQEAEARPGAPEAAEG